jgi:hypothetical protein
MRRTVRSLSLLAGFFTVAAVLWPVEAYTQRGRAHIRTGSVRVVRGNFYRPVYYGPCHNRYFWGSGWGPYGFYPSIWYAQYPRYRYAYDEASLRIQVTPRDAQVYVDGYYVGMVDSFDGTFQRLHLSPGEHVIEIFLEGYRTIREPMLFRPREGYHLRRAMEPLTVGDPAAERPRPDPTARHAPPSYPGDARRPERMRDPRSGQIRSDEGGAIVVRVQPEDATLIVDGQKWDTPAGREPLTIQLSEGAHRIEVQKEGFRTFSTEVRVRRGETVPLNISLRSGGAD